MNFFERIANWIGLDSSTTQNRTALNDLRVVLDRGRQSKRAERYDEALDEFQTAVELARESYNQATLAIIELQRVDVLTRQGRWTEAQTLLDELDGLSNGDPSQRAYIRIARGVLANERGDADDAQTHFEEARTVAQEGNVPGAEGRAEGHLGDLYLKEGNASYGAHLLQGALEKLDASGDLELSSYFVGRLGQAMIANGQENEGRQLLGRALRLAEQMAYRVYERLWRLVLGAEAMEMARYADARRQYRSALLLMDETVASVDRVMLLCRLAKVCLQLYENDEAQAHARKAVETADALEGHDEVRNLARAALGICLRTAGQYADALPLLESAPPDALPDVESLRADFGAVEVLRNLAAVRAELHDVAGASATYEQALELATSLDLPVDLAGAHRDIGVLHAREGRPQDAIESWKTAIQIYERESQYARVARLHCEIGNLRSRTDPSKRILRDYENALTVLNLADDDETRGIVLANAATAYVDYGDIETAESFVVESIRLAQKLDDRPAEATRRGNYGWLLLSTGRAEQALTTLEHALRQSDILGLELQAAVQTDNRGLAYDEMGSYEQALAEHEQALALLDAMTDPYWLAAVKANTGHTLISLNRLDEAVPLLEQAVTTARAGGHGDVLVRALHGQGRLALAQGDHQSGGARLDEALNEARRMGMRRPLVNLLMTYGAYQAERGEASAARETWEEASHLLEILGIDPQIRRPAWLVSVDSS
jgi:tetratricopeptide (TPR) repeat protein